MERRPKTNYERALERELDRHKLQYIATRIFACIIVAQAVAISYLIY